VGNDDVVAAVDDKTIVIFPFSSATLSSLDHQLFTQFQPPTNALPFTVSEGMGNSIGATNDIRIRIPAGFNMTWAPMTPLTISGPASSFVSQFVTYEDSFRTLVIPVIGGFSPSDYITVSGARFQGFSAVSAPDRLVLDVGPTALDDKTVEIGIAGDLPFFTATAKDGEVKLEWLAVGGLCDFVLLLRRDDGVEPTGPGDLNATVLDNRPCTLGVKDSYLDDTPALTNGNLYAYAAFVDYGGIHTAGKFVKARPMDSVATPVQWAYSTGATAMAPPGLRFYSGLSYVYAVSNDSILHSMNGGPTGGDWPTDWKPYPLGAPAQARPPVVPFAVGTATEGAAFLGSQDGLVYTVNARDGSEVWKQTVGPMVQAAPAGSFLAVHPTALNAVIAGTRNASGGSALVALDLNTGGPIWSFVNSLAQNGDGKDIGIINGSASIDYPNQRAIFASRARGGANGSSTTLWCVYIGGGGPFLLWSRALGDIDGSPVLWGSRVYVGTNGGVLYAIDSPTGNTNWSHPIGDGPIKAFVFPQPPTNRVLVATNGKITSVDDLGTGYNVNWQVPSANVPGPSTPVYVPGTGKILVGSSDGHLYQLDAFTPLPATRVQLGDGSAAVGTPSMDVLTDMIYVGTDEGIIYGVTFPLP
jgi:outer membrane protein assembly factor BamB